MSNSTDTYIDVLTSQKDKAISIFKHFDEIPESVKDFSHGEHSLISFYFGDLDGNSFIATDELKKQGIAFDMRIGLYKSADRELNYCKFKSDGEYEFKFSNETPVSYYFPKFKELLSNPESLAAHISELIDKNIPLPWDNQEEYGKLYKLKQLLTS